MILEDLTFRNYSNVPRAQGLNFDQIKDCLGILAVWHAASVKLIQDVSIFGAHPKGSAVQCECRK